ncbi:WAP domain containing protein, SLPI-like [Trichuris trichiura]|uniref:WAP domain containing protein, SLPI-like n=1 Tax=Trichuris trichiura TaxID=36087 RepID=A0A077ZJX5_TRITR|nr:WAP domain containing protein, SLPI-like [Trichuris trichiura]
MTAPSPLLIGLAICLLQGIQDAESAKVGRCPSAPFGAGRARFCYTDRQCPGRMKCCLTKRGYACTAPDISYPDAHKQKPGTCPPSNMFTGTAPFCNRDTDCKGIEKCCLTKAGHQCVQPNQTPRPTAKKGSCPPKPTGAVGLANFCQNDYDCDGSMKCCLTNVGYDCKAPVQESEEVEKPGSCPPAPAVTGKALFCRSDKDCDRSEKCCLTKVGKECVQPTDKPKPITKKGSCPPTPPGPVGLASFCQNDYDCDGSKKCCLTSIGYDCKAPVQESMKTSPIHPIELCSYKDPIGEEVQKPGSCPAAPAVTGKALFCRGDKDCDGSEKCCFTKVGKECVQPTDEPKPIAKKGSCPPTPVGPVGLANFCQTDYDCDGSMKCCLTTIGYDCKAPVQESMKISPIHPIEVCLYKDPIGKEVKRPGSCPAAPAVTGKALFCRSDKDCDGSEKCCFTKVGKECVRPTEERMLSSERYDNADDYIRLANPIPKKGSCPPTPEGPVGLANFCQTDYDCDGSMKCCLTTIGYDCKAPVQESMKISPIHPIELCSYKDPIGEEVQKPGSCPAAPAITGKALFCRSDKDCDGSEKCCFTKVGKECVQPTDEPKPIAKKGSCPPAPVGPVGLANFCQTDYDCDGSMKCCLTSIGYDCKAPVQESMKISPIHPIELCSYKDPIGEEVQKPGSCPAAPAITGKALFCRSDKDCDGSEKCCFTKVGKECVQPTDEPKPIAKKGSCPPAPVGPVGLANFCQTDYDCDGSMKCCLTTIGYDCKAPVQKSMKISPIHPIEVRSYKDPIGEEVQKPGSCPAAPAVTGKALFCRNDNDCDGREKCCSTKVGKECVQPVRWPGPNVKPGSCPPSPVGAVGLASFCQSDFDCMGYQKCCITTAGYECTHPVDESKGAIETLLWVVFFCVILTMIVKDHKNVAPRRQAVAVLMLLVKRWQVDEFRVLLLPTCFCKVLVEGMKIVTMERNAVTAPQMGNIASIDVKNAKIGKSHTIGEEVLIPVISEVLNTVLHIPAADVIKKVSLSNFTVQRRIEDMAAESNLPGNEALLLTYVRFLKAEQVVQEMLFAKELITDTRGELIFLVLRGFYEEKEIALLNITAVATDGTPAMMGRQRGFIAHLKQVVPDIVAVHCVIDREHLAAKRLNDRLNSSLQLVINAISKIKSNPLSDRLFRQLCEESDSEYKRLLQHTEERWLSRGACLTRFFCLFEAVVEFSLPTTMPCFNEMNLLQGDELNLITTRAAVCGFVRKLPLFRRDLARRELGQFPNLCAFQEKMEIKDDNVEAYCHYLDMLHHDPSARIQEELVELQANEELKVKFSKNGHQAFWLQRGIAASHAGLWNIARKLLLAFPSTYLAERGFSVVADLLTKKRNRLQIAKRGDLRLRLTNFKPNVQKLVSSWRI